MVEVPATKILFLAEPFSSCRAEHCLESSILENGSWLVKTFARASKVCVVEQHALVTCAMPFAHDTEAMMSLDFVV